MNNVKAGQKCSAEKRPVLLDEDRWLFAYEEQAEQACAEHDTEGKQRSQRADLRIKKDYPTQGVMLDNLIRDATAVAQLSSNSVFTPQVEELLARVKEENEIDFEEKTRRKSQLLNVAFGSILHYLKSGECSSDFANVIGMLHWFSAGLLEGSLRAFEHLKERQALVLETNEQNHREEISRLQAELQDVLEAAETFEKEAQGESESRQKAQEEFARQCQEYED